MVDPRKDVTTVWSCERWRRRWARIAWILLRVPELRRVVTMMLLECNLDRRLVPLRGRAGAGAGKLPEGYMRATAADLNGAYSGRLGEGKGCAKTWTVSSGAPIVTRNVTTTTTGWRRRPGGMGRRGRWRRVRESAGLLVVAGAIGVWFGIQCGENI